MTYHSIRNTSYFTSFGLHFLLLIIMYFVYISFDFPPLDFVELSFGVSGGSGSSGATGTQINQIEEVAERTEETTTEDNKNLEVKEVELPVAKNSAKENVITPADKGVNLAEATKTKNELDKTSNVTQQGKGNKAEGEGSFGYKIDWGGQGTRKIYSFSIPQYPSGVSKEVDIRLRFSILPDGSVGTIFPQTKADTKLENTAINALRQWRFEPLSSNQKQIEQAAVIVFPYRLQ
ncbi:MAG: energy transducer TonB [Ignavibacteriaceae bacterium]|nr:energy transducer TonB [Ignavibacteriaceae bacterium]